MGERLVFCNERFLTLYRLPADVIKPGCTLADIFRIRAASNTFRRDPEAYRGRMVKITRTTDGKSWGGRPGETVE